MNTSNIIIIILVNKSLIITSFLAQSKQGYEKL